MVTRRFLLRAAGFGLCLALTAFGGWAVRPYLPVPSGPGPAAAHAPETTEELIARLEELRTRKRDLTRQEREFSEQIRIQKAEIDRQEAGLVSELKKREEENQRRLANLGHRNSPAIANAR